MPGAGASAVSWLMVCWWVQQPCPGLYCLCAYFCASQRQALDRSLFQHVSTHTTVALDIAWPWASEDRGLAGCAHTFVPKNTYVRKIIWPYRSTDRCFKHATNSIVALDTAWPWAIDAYGLCCLPTYFCAHNLIRARSYVTLPPNRNSYAVLTANKNEFALAFERVSVLVLWSWVLVLSIWLRVRCQLAECAGAGVSWLCAMEVPYAGWVGCAHPCSSQSHVNRSWDYG